MTELETYRRKRSFDRSPEPSGRKRRSQAGGLSFVVQKHAASHLHYDFRLEWEGVLLSWAVPKGPVPDPSVKRLAMRTEDHPLDYADFEGVIPEGEYGGGTVMVWDRGHWVPAEDAGKGLRKGRLDFELEGEKLRGRWTMVRTGGEGERERWLLFKRNDEHARAGSGTALLEEQDLSVVTGRSLREIAEDRQRVWEPGEDAGGEGARAPGAARVDVASAPGAREGRPPGRIDPQLAKLVKSAPGGDDWLHEIKYDGYRLILHVDGEEAGAREARLVTRNGKDWTDRFQRIARAASALPVRRAVLDGEAVVVDAEGRSDFQALQNAIGGADRDDLYFYAFDLLHLDGWNLGRTPLETRKALLSDLLESAPGVLRYSDHVTGDGPTFHREACRMGLEGVVSKRRGSPYSSGRGGDWVKTKCVRRQEFVVVGWTEPSGSRTGLGALVLGVHDEAGRLTYAGRVGTGFTARDLDELRKRLEPLARKTPPVKGAPRSARGRAIHWVRPALVAEVTFTEWTSDGVIRHPSFQGLREDKPVEEVVRETEDGDGPEAPEGAAKAAGDPADAGAELRSLGVRPEERSPGPRGRRSTSATVAGVVVTNPDRVLYPDVGVTKLEVARYWESVADVALPLLVDRPLTLYRCPRGIGGECFYQKHATDSIPETVRRVAVPEKGGEAKPEPYMLLDGLPSLLTLVQLGTLELHVWNARADRLQRPDTLVMDVDPGPDVPWAEVVRAALALRDLLAELGLASWPRGTGGKGLHVVVPLVRRSGWDGVTAFAEALSGLMASAAPDLFVSTAKKSVRKGRIYVDYLRNVRNATAIGTFSPRARPGAPVAVPLGWDEVVTSDAPPLLSVREAAEVDWLERDPWTGFAAVRQSITGPMREALGLD